MALTLGFTGNRPQKVDWLGDKKSEKYKILKLVIMQKICEYHKEGYRHFISGMALGADMLAAECVLQLKKRLAGLRLECALPHIGQENAWQIGDIKRYRRILKRADTVSFISQGYFNGCMHKRNRYIVDNCDSLLAVWNGERSGGTYYTAEYAKNLQKPVALIDLTIFPDAYI